MTMSYYVLYTTTTLQVLSSGYVLQDIDALDDVDDSNTSRCSLTYVHQLGSSVMPFFSQDLLGVSTLIEKLTISLRRYLLEQQP